MKMGRKLAGLAASISLLAFGMGGTASAHVTVKPAEVLTGTFQTFTVNVPVEKDQPTIAIKLMLPEAIKSATPTVKPGWTITVEKEGGGETAVATSITWSGGQIGTGLRDEFTFSAKTPDNVTDLQWKAYQTYQDGTVVSWDQQPGSAGNEAEGKNTGPFSVTQVTDETAQDTAIKKADQAAIEAKTAAGRSFVFAIAGIAVGLVGIFFATRKQQ